MRKNPKKTHDASRGTEVNFGSYGMKALSAARVRSNQIEASRRVISRVLGKAGRLWISCVSGQAVDAESGGSRYGKGKG